MLASKGVPHNVEMLPGVQLKPRLLLLGLPPWTGPPVPSPSLRTPSRAPSGLHSAHIPLLHLRLPGKACSPPPSSAAQKAPSFYSPSWLLGGASAAGAWGLGSSLLCSGDIGLGSEFSRAWGGMGAAGTSAGLGTWISTLLEAASMVGAAGPSGILEVAFSILRWADSWGLTMVISVLRGVGSGGVLWPSASARLSPNRDGPVAPALSTCLDEMSMEISVRRDTGSALGPGSSTLRRAALGERWLRESTCRAAGSEFFTPRSWNFWVELATVARSRGVWTLRGGVELGVSTSSTSNDLFKAERQREEEVMSGQLGNTQEHAANGEHQKVWQACCSGGPPGHSCIC